MTTQGPLGWTTLIAKQIIDESGVELPMRGKLRLKGAGVSLVDNPTTGETEAEIAAGEVPTVDTYAELRAIPSTTTTPRLARGATVAGDGAAGVFYTDPTLIRADDGGSVIKPDDLGDESPGRRVRIFSGARDPRWFGAKGDGVTDDTTAVQACLDAGYGIEAQREVIIDRAYACPGGLTVKSTAAFALTVRGSGRSAEIISVRPGTDTVAIGVAPVVAASFGSFTLRDLALSGTFSRGVDLTGSAGATGNVRVERCKVSGHTAFAGGVTLAAIVTGSMDDVWIVDNDVSGGGYDNGDGTGQGYDILKRSGATQSRIHVVGNRVTGAKTVLSVALFDVADSEVQNNIVDQGNTPGSLGPPVTFGYGIAVYDIVHLDETRRNRIAGNTVKNCAGLGIYTQKSHDTTITGNVLQDTCKQITEPSLPLAAIVTNGNSASITGNVVKTSGKACIAIQNPNTAVIGNYLEGSASDAGISFRGDAHNSVISGNTMVNTYHGVLVNGTNPTGVSITGNTFKGVSAPLSVQPASSLSHSVYSHNVSDGGGLLLSAGSTDNLIAANTVQNSPARGINVLDARNTVIDNTVTGSATEGIYVAADYCRVSGNVSTGSGGTEITVTGTGNLRERNRTSATGAYEDPAAIVGELSIQDGTNYSWSSPLTTLNATPAMVPIVAAPTGKLGAYDVTVWAIGTKATTGETVRFCEHHMFEVASDGSMIERISEPVGLPYDGIGIGGITIQQDGATPGTIEAVITGKAATTISWSLKATVLVSLG